MRKDAGTKGTMELDGLSENMRRGELYLQEEGEDNSARVTHIGAGTGDHTRGKCRQRLGGKDN